MNIQRNTSAFTLTLRWSLSNQPDPRQAAARELAQRIAYAIDRVAVSTNWGQPITSNHPIVQLVRGILDTWPSVDAVDAPSDLTVHQATEAMLRWLRERTSVHKRVFEHYLTDHEEFEDFKIALRSVALPILAAAQAQEAARRNEKVWAYKEITPRLGESITAYQEQVASLRQQLAEAQVELARTRAERNLATGDAQQIERQLVEAQRALEIVRSEIVAKAEGREPTASGLVYLPFTTDLLAAMRALAAGGGGAA